MKQKFLLLFLVLGMADPFRCWASQNTGTELLIKKLPIIQAFTELNKNIVASTDYDYGWVKQGSNKGKWTLSTTSINYTVSPYFSPYVEVDLWNRLGARDYTVAAGNSSKFKDNSFLNAEIGFGGDAIYLYRFQSQLEYGHRLTHTFFWEIGGRYSNYADNDTYLIYPGLIYYFGDNDISVFYNQTLIESRGSGSSGTLRAHFVLNNRLSLYAGAAAGAWLYDIDGLPASQESGYIGFAGFSYKITPWLSARTGFSYSMEKPGFIKRSAEVGLSAKF